MAEPSTPSLPSRVAGTVASSPHYVTTRRHSLYGTEDRIIIDPGSRIWKAGFSGEGRPRDLFYCAAPEKDTLWTLSRSHGNADKEEEERLLRAKLQEKLRTVFHQCLLTDPKSRKVIIVENPLLPLYIKDMMASILFENLQVPSISFACSHLLALLGVGRITGLVVDCGYLETTVLPIFTSRPLFPLLRTTPLAGARFSSHLRALLLLFGTYIPPLASLGGALGASSNAPPSSRATRIPVEVLTDAVIEEVKTRCCFVGAALDIDSASLEYSDLDDGTVTEVGSDVPQSDSSQFDHDAMDADVPSSPPSTVLSPPSSSAFSTSTSAVPAGDRKHGGEAHLRALASLYSRHSTATELRLKVDPPPGQQTGTGRGTLVIPGWIREHGAEVLFEGGDVDERSVAEVILDTLLKLPVDLRKTLASSVLVVGGTPMLPGFIPRLHSELRRALTRPPPPPRHHGRRNPRLRPSYDPYAVLRPLVSDLATLNNPSPPPPTTMSTAASANAGKAPAFMPSCLPWIGGSLAGALKIGGVEISREKWDEAHAGDDDEDEDEESNATYAGREVPAKRPAFQLPDWTRTPLPPGAPHAPRAPRLEEPSQQTAVSA